MMQLTWQRETLGWEGCLSLVMRQRMWASLPEPCWAVLCLGAPGVRHLPSRRAGVVAVVRQPDQAEAAAGHQPMGGPVEGHPGQHAPLWSRGLWLWRCLVLRGCQGHAGWKLRCLALGML
jgi:hypothetical protein